MCAVVQTDFSHVCIFKTQVRYLMRYAVGSLVINNKSSHPVKVRKIANALKPCLSYRLRIIN